jgi:peptide/nickel transport system substrate-binding protein
MLTKVSVGRSAGRLLVLALAAALVLSGCSKGTQTPQTGPDQPQAAAKKEGPITVALAGDTTTLDPSGTELITWAIVRNQVFEALLKMDPKTLEMKPHIAQSWKWEDPTTLSITIRPNVTFHDGQKLTAEDVKFSILHFVDPTTGSPFRGRMASVQAIDVVSETELKLRLSAPDAGVIGGLGQVFLVKKDTPVETLKAKANGTGPYKLVEWQQGNFIKLEPNTSYWNGSAPAQPLTFKIMSQMETRISSALAGDVDVLLDVDLKEVPRLQKESAVSLLLSSPGDNMWVAYLNARRPALKDERVRKALAYALDRETYVKAFQSGLAKVTNSPHSALGAFYDKATEGQYPYDLKKAAALLAEAGYPGGKGLKLTLVFPSGYPDLKTGSEMWQSALAELGVQAEVKELELAAWSNAVAKQFDFDIAWDIKQDGASDPAVLYSTTGSFAPGPTNRNAMFEDTYPELTALLKQGKGTLDPAERVATYHKVNEFWNEHMIQYTIAAKPVAYAVRKGVSGLDPHPSIRYLDLTKLKRQ